MSLTSYRAAPPRVKYLMANSGKRIEPLIYSPFAIRHLLFRKEELALGRPGDDLLSQVLRHSTIGAEAFDGRVRDGIGSDRFAESHQAGERQE
jgi:hypothetical protein